MKVNKPTILYEDNHIIVVTKPPNMPSQEDDSQDLDLLRFIKQYLKEKYQKPGNVYLGLVHRLDRPVGGVMVFAKTSKAASRLAEQVRTHQVKKEYLAVIRGLITKQEDTLQDYLDKDEKYNAIVTTKDKGKEAVLHYKVLEQNTKKKETLVKIDLKTGRHHQIRIQFASRGFPLCGDQRYGKKDRTPIALYAYRLTFFHPITKQQLQFFSLPNKTDYWTHFTLSTTVNKTI